MNKLKEMLDKLIAEGKDAKQVTAALILENDEAAKMEASDVIAMVEKAFKANAAVKLIEDKEVATEEGEKFDAAVEAAVKKIMEKRPAAAPEKKEVSRFNVVTGKHQDYSKMSESYKAMADSLYFSLKGDTASLAAVQKDVDAEVKSTLETMGIKTALYSNTGSGAYAVPTEVSSDIAVSRYNQSAMYRKANKQGILFNGKVYPVATDMTFAHRTNENTAWGDKTPTLENPTITIQEYGGLALLSRRLVEIRSPEVVQMLINAAGSADARFIDLASAAYSVTTDADPFNGLIFDSLTAGVTSKALSAIIDQDFIDLIAELSDNVDDITFIANRKVRNAYGRLETGTGGARLFADFMSNGSMAPMGHDFIENRKIPSTLTINASSGNTNKRAAGSSDCIIAADLSKLFIVAGMMRVDYSEHYKFAEDQVAWKFVNEIGVDVVTDSGNVVAAVLELTN